MSQQTVNVTFLPDGLVTPVKKGRRLLNIIIEAGRPIGYSCRGMGVCTACVIRVSGDAGPLGEREESLLRALDNDEVESGDTHRRLACLAQAQSDLSITTDYW